MSDTDTASTQPESGKQGSSTVPLFTPTTSTTNADGVSFAWDLIEAECRKIGIPAVAEKYKLPPTRIRSRARDHKWKKIPDGRTLVKHGDANGSELATMTGDLSVAIDRHRAMVFEKTSKSIAKFRPKAPKSFRELDSADKVARRALGIDDTEPAKASVLIQINEAIENHEMQPVEAHEIVPCLPESVHESGTVHEHVNEGQQGDNATPRSSTTPPAESNVQKESDAPKESAHSLTLNPSDSSRRRFVVP